MNNIATGGLGFLGSHLVDALLRDETNHVEVVDHAEGAVAEWETLDKYWRASFRYSLSCAPLALCLPCALEPAEVIYHLASPVGPLGVLGYKPGMIATRIPADTFALARWVRENKARLIHVSSSEVYGGGVEGVCSEEMECRLKVEGSARGEYAVGKLAAEVLLLNMAREEGLDVVIVRPFNITGPRQSPKGGFVLPRFVLQALLGLPLTVYGDGTQMRAFTHVQDIVQGLLGAAQKGKAGEIYNLGNPVNRISIYDLATLVLDEVGCSGCVELVDPQKLHGARFQEAPDKYPSACKAFEELDWCPATRIREIIADTIDYWRSRPEEWETWRTSLS